MCNRSFNQIILKEELRKLLNKYQLVTMRKKGLPFIELSRVHRIYLEGSVIEVVE